MLLDLSDHGAAAMAEAVQALVVPQAPVRLFHPIGTVDGGAGFVEAALGPLWQAMPDVERRVDISVRGTDGHGQVWHGEAGHYAGTFAAPFLGVPPTGRMAFLRYHEFYRIEEERAVEVQAIWDLPDLMLQAGIWPMGPALGRTGLVPGPATRDGVRPGGDGTAAVTLVGDMLAHLNRSDEGVAAMRLEAFWHPRCSWYGPGGIGTARGIAGFRAQHQIPFLDAMPDRKGLVERGHFFGEGDYAAFTAWPGMEMTLTGGGWLGIAGAGQRITMRSLDFWRVEGGLIRENWVTVDLLDVWAQLGVDVLARMRQLRSG
ncbi:ester cyclase [Jannaschia aquimarina]|uniref:SnoaL-like domain protein n=1 Tax=Jannaschia aquimarina TaxID=935700 RepID=A0A0D1CIU1_9RHOB|nr:ester cyclase [Jannaschia aquimarina]KIT14642.1 SnoaL-like domain protein [Jannaschia aquimarina]SNT37567.1 Predicted ester cyclase [Jannaschia aquimarina]